MSQTAPAEFEYIQKLVRERSAIVLEDGKVYLADSRLAPLAREEGFQSITELVAQLRGERFGRLHRRVVEAMTTNETSFFRDLHPFEALRSAIFPELVGRRATTRTLDIWCAASSTGQEPYSLALTIREHFPALATWNVRITATDLNTEVLARAGRGTYSQLEVNRGLPAPMLVKYFERKGLEWQLKDDVRRLVTFRELNLAESWPTMGPLDLVMLRNVLIYFDVETKRAILGKVRRLLRPDGYLFLGGAETTINLDDGFERAQFGKAWAYRVRGGE
ncbi:MAG: protein-glutamate O-methyltransferase CheR [Candidatus Binatia bacterium]